MNKRFIHSRPKQTDPLFGTLQNEKVQMAKFPLKFHNDPILSSIIGRPLMILMD